MTKKLLVYLTWRISEEEKALSQDHPRSRCAANHRGAIRILNEILDRAKRKEFGK